MLLGLEPCSLVALGRLQHLVESEQPPALKGKSQMSQYKTNLLAGFARQTRF